MRMEWFPGIQHAGGRRVARNCRGSLSRFGGASPCRGIFLLWLYYRERFHSRYFLAVTSVFQFVPVARPEPQCAMVQAFFSDGLPARILQ
jgi:hypothetical protein